MTTSIIAKRTILKNGADDPATHDTGAITPGTTTPVVDDKGGLSSGSDDPATHDLTDDKGGLTSGSDDPATHDVADDKGKLSSSSEIHGIDHESNHDASDDSGHHVLKLFVNSTNHQLIFTDDKVEVEHWSADTHKSSLALPVAAPTASTSTVAVYRFHDSASDVYYWTADDKVKDSLVQSHPEIEFHGEAFQAYKDHASGGTTAIGVVWDHSAPGQYGSFTYAVNDDAVRIAGQSSTDGLEYMGVAFWI